MSIRLRITLVAAFALLALPVDPAGAVAGLPIDTQVLIFGSTYYLGDGNVAMSPLPPTALPEVIVTAGHKLFVTNLDTTAHTLVSDIVDGDGRYLFTAPPPSIPFRTTVEVQGVSTLAPATYGFHCDLHPGMTGTLIVESPIGG